MTAKEFSERRGNATSARLSMIESFKAAQAAAAPRLAARSAERVEIAQAREARRATRDAERLAEVHRVAAQEAALAEEQLQLEAAEIATRDARQSAQDKRIALVLSDEAAGKAARDQRYAKRKAAQQVA